jgi:hypothetical protein
MSGGRGSGWTLNVKQEAEFSSSLKSKTDILTGAELSLGTAQGKAELLGSGGNNPYKPGKVQEVTTLIPNESVDLIVARPEEGLGTWIYRFGNEKNDERRNFINLSNASLYCWRLFIHFNLGDLGCPGELKKSLYIFTLINTEHMEIGKRSSVKGDCCEAIFNSSNNVFRYRNHRISARSSSLGI